MNRLIAALVLTAIFTLTSFVQRPDAVVTNPKSYSLQFHSSLTSPADATAYYTGGVFSVGLASAAVIVPVWIPKSGIIRGAWVNVANFGTACTAETSTIYLRVNDTTDTTIVSTLVTNAVGSFANTAMSVAVNRGDYVTIKWVAPTWATNPTNVTIGGVIHVDVP